MDTNSNKYTFIYASVMVILVAALLSLAATILKPYQDNNVKIEKMQYILRSVNLDVEASEAEKVFEETIVESYIVDTKGNKQSGEAFNVDLKVERTKAAEEMQLPVYIAKVADNKIRYIIPIRGAGLWGPIWGYVALNDDRQTIYGAIFDHQGETPGLGAEIAAPSFQEQFKGKEIFDANGAYANFVVAKTGEKAAIQSSVDAISGGTITSKGVEAMLAADLKLYQEFFKNLR